MSENLPRIVNLKQGPLDVRFTCEPVEAIVHWLPKDGRRGSTMPCLGAACTIHQLGRPRPIVLATGVIRPRTPDRRIDDDEANRQKLRNFKQLPAEVRAKLLAQARQLPSLAGQGSVAPLGLLEQHAADLLWPPKPQAQKDREWEAVVVDLPIGAGRACAKELDGQPWTGNRVLFLRAHVGAETAVRRIEGPSSTVIVPDSYRFDLGKRMARHWCYPPECARMELDSEAVGGMVLTFATCAAAIATRFNLDRLEQDKAGSQAVHDPDYVRDIRERGGHP